MPSIVDMLTNSISGAEYVGDRLLEKHLNTETGIKVFDRTWTVRQIAQELELPASQIKQAIAGIDEIDHLPRADHFKEYSLASLNLLREHFRLSPRRGPTDLAKVLAVMSGKGGVAKSTLSLYLAQSLAIKGYRILLIDADPQSTITTFALGVVADAVFGDDDTLAEAMLSKEETLADKICPTPVDGLFLIPACQHLQSAEITFASRHTNDDHQLDGTAWLTLRDSIDEISHNFDIVIVDTAPMPSNINISTALTADMIITPITPSPIDFFSTVSYVRALSEYIEQIADSCHYTEEDLSRLKTHRFVLTKQKHVGAHKFFAKLIRHAFKGHIYESAFLESTEISNTSNDMNTLLERNTAVSSSTTRKTTLENISLLVDEIEVDIRAGWVGMPDTELEPNYSEAVGA